MIPRPWLTGLLLFPAMWPAAHACLICLPVPTTSPADYLLESEVIVLAREDPGSPYWLRTVKVLKGDPAGVDRDFFLEAPLQPERSPNRKREVICAYGSQGGSPKPEWAWVGAAEATFTPMVEEILQHGERWKTNPDERAAFFAGHLGHRDQQVRALAHLEVARAPYDRIREFAGALAAEDLRTSLQNFRLTEWHPLYILLLAQGDEPRDHQLIAGKVRSAEESKRTLHLAAWVTAWIEIDPEAALDFVETHYLANGLREAGEIRAISRALSVHGNRGHVHLRDRIVGAYRQILRRQPGLAPGIVTDLMAWERWDLAGAIVPVVMAPPPDMNQASLLQLRAYLRKAGEVTTGNARGVGTTNPRLILVIIMLALLMAIPAGLSLRRWRAGRRREAAPRAT
ncbi:MAG: hypothetical protein CMP31_13165 [Roseibacillus sp.]|nr:hypothetical protein [Roseibacillus sp.]